MQTLRAALSHAGRHASVCRALHNTSRPQPRSMFAPAAVPQKQVNAIIVPILAGLPPSD